MEVFLKKHVILFIMNILDISSINNNILDINFLSNLKNYPKIESTDKFFKGIPYYEDNIKNIENIYCFSYLSKYKK